MAATVTVRDAGVQASLRGLRCKTVDNFTTGSRRFEYSLHTVLRRRFARLGSDTLDDRFALHNPHGDSPGGGRTALFIGSPPTGLRAPERASTAPRPIHCATAPRTRIKLHNLRLDCGLACQRQRRAPCMTRGSDGDATLVRCGSCRVVGDREDVDVPSSEKGRRAGGTPDRARQSPHPQECCW